MQSLYFIFTQFVSLRECSEQQEKLMAQLEDIHEQLNEAKVDIRSDQREARFRDALESMKRIFPGVIGRMVCFYTFSLL